MLEYIRSPADVKALSEDELGALCEEIRESILSAVSKNGGHLASNLGLVEATLAIHRVFDAPRDKIIFDVSHQAYTHKIITGRAGKLGTLRMFGGLSGFTLPSESEYDTVCAGHSGSSIATALGIAAANRHRGSDAYAIAVVGDGSFTNGMIYEAINNCAEHRDLNLIVILNDNDMSITENVGGISRYLSRVRTSRGYLSFKHSLDELLGGIPIVGGAVARALKWVKDSFKRIFIRDTLFENLGIPYIGPVDGHDIGRLEAVLTEAKRRQGVWLIHIVTRKGLGYTDAERFPEKYHSTGPFDLKVGVSGECGVGFTSKFGEILCAMAERDDKIFAVTGAMRDGTGLREFSERFRDRYADVGIAEEHAVAYCGGLSISGMNPVFAVYSTFAQRVFDQVMHDVSLQRAHVTLALDHCGIVSGDGATHQGVYDVSLFAPIPNVTIYSPETYSELEEAMGNALGGANVTIVRYPKGAEISYDRTGFERAETFTYRMPEAARGRDSGSNCNGDRNCDCDCDCVIVTYGIIAEEAVRAADMLSDRYRIGIVKLTRVHPLDGDALREHLSRARLIYVLEEGVLTGGVGERIASFASECGLAPTHIRAIGDEFVPHGDRESLLKLLGLDAESAAAEIAELIEAYKPACNCG